MPDQVNYEDQLKTLQTTLKDIQDNVKKTAEQTEKEIKQFGASTSETKKQADELLTKMNETLARVSSMEQAVVANSGYQDKRPERVKTAGELVVENEHYKEVNSSFRGSRRIEIPRSAITSIDGSGGALVTPDRQYGVVAAPEMRLTIRDLIAPGKTNSNSVEYVKETGFTNNATTIAEGSDKPYSDIKYELENAPIRVIAHLFKASRQILDDAPALLSLINARAGYGIKLAEEAQLLYGNGTGSNIAGLIPQARVYAAPSGITVEKEQRIDRIRLAILQAALSDLPASGIVLHPIDWAAIELTKDGNSAYIIGRPQEGTTPLLWKLPVVETTAIKQNEFLTGAFSLGAQIFDRMTLEILLSTENDKDFEKNMISIRAEERLGLADYRPEAFVTGKLVDTP